jgi:hypothetical protein
MYRTIAAVSAHLRRLRLQFSVEIGGRQTQVVGRARIDRSSKNQATVGASTSLK